MNEIDEVIELGKECTVAITGSPEDADEVRDFSTAMLTIRECIRLGIKSHNELNRLMLQCRSLVLKVSSNAQEAAKAKDATDYIAGYQDALVDYDEELRTLLDQNP